MGRKVSSGLGRQGWHTKCIVLFELIKCIIYSQEANIEKHKLTDFKNVC